MTATADPVDDRRRRSVRMTVRGVRLASGLVLLAYVLTHFVNHMLGNVSLDAMEAGLGWAGAVWWSPPGQAALYGAFAAHLALGLWALYDRRPFRYRPTEATQLAFGLLIPLLLVQHIVGTRVAYALHGTDKGYAQVLAYFVIEAPLYGLLQAVTLVVVWAHGVVGLHLWLRLKPWFARAAPLLLCLAVLVPVLSLLGAAQGGREVVRRAADPAWRALQLGPERTGSAAENLGLVGIANTLLLGYLGLLAATVAARFVRAAHERRRGFVSICYPSGRRVRVPAGLSVLEASRLFRIPHASVCGGRGRCSTCRVRVVATEVGLPAPSEAEQAVLDRVRAGAGVRLACQLRPAGDLTVAPLLAPGITVEQLRDLDASGFGEERFVVSMFVDMRGSTRLAETRLPYDTVFLINRFLEAVGSAVAESGGTPNQFLGDGLLALFGLTGTPEAAAREGLTAIGKVAERVAALNTSLAGSIDEPIRFGIGLHAGTAILGEIGDRARDRTVFTAIGDPVNVAARLQGMTKAMGVEALISDAVFAAAGWETDLPHHSAAIEGREGQLWVRPLERAASGWRAGAETV